MRVCMDRSERLCSCGYVCVSGCLQIYFLLLAKINVGISDLKISTGGVSGTKIYG